MQQTEIDKVTDETNLWLNAVKQDEAGNLMEAYSLYLKNAITSLNQNLLVYAALSYSCAASCLKRMGKQTDAEKLYLEAAKIYQQYVDATKSLREGLWALLQAYDHALLANDTITLREIEKKYITIKLKVDPFSNEEKIIHHLRLRKDWIFVSRDSNFKTYEKVEEKKLEQKELEIQSKEKQIVNTVKNFPEVIPEPVKGIEYTVLDGLCKFEQKEEPEKSKQYYFDLYMKNTKEKNNEVLKDLYRQYRYDLQNKDLYFQIDAISRVIDEQVKGNLNSQLKQEILLE